MKRWQFVGAALTALLSLAPPGYASTQGTLQAAGRTGQVSLFRVKDQCLALTAGHVVGDAVQASVLIGQAKNYRAKVLYKPEAVDLALLVVETGGEDRDCADALGPSTGVQTLMNSGSEVLVLLAGGGLFGGAVSSHDQTWTRLEMRPGQMSDPRIEEGISGALVVRNGSPLGVVTDIRSQGADKIVRLISFDEVRRQFADYFPAARSTLDTPWDISWWPQSARDAIKASMDVGDRAASTVNRAAERVNSTKAIVGNARAVPNNIDQIDPYLVYYFRADATAAEMRSQIKAVSTTAGKFSYSPHGLGEQINVPNGRNLIGQWVNGKMILGQVINGVTPQSSQGSDRIYGLWDEQGNLVEGGWYLADGRQLIGNFKGNNITRGRITYPDGSIFNGEWPKGSDNPEGSCVWWGKDGTYQQGGLCKEGKLVTPYRRH